MKLRANIEFKIFIETQSVKEFYLPSPSRWRNSSSCFSRGLISLTSSRSLLPISVTLLSIPVTLLLITTRMTMTTPVVRVMTTAAPLLRMSPVSVLRISVVMMTSVLVVSVMSVLRMPLVVVVMVVPTTTLVVPTAPAVVLFWSHHVSARSFLLIPSLVSVTPVVVLSVPVPGVVVVLRLQLVLREGLEGWGFLYNVSRVVGRGCVRGDLLLEILCRLF